MYQVTGQLINLFNSPATEKYEAAYRIQILGDMLTRDGQVKKEMITLNIPLPIFDSLRGEEGNVITLPIGFYAKDGKILTYCPKSEAKNFSITDEKTGVQKSA